MVSKKRDYVLQDMVYSKTDKLNEKFDELINNLRCNNTKV